MCSNYFVYNKHAEQSFKVKFLNVANFPIYSVNKVKQ